MAKPDDGGESKTIGARVDNELLEQFMLAIRKQQTEGELDLETERSEVIRRLIRAYVSDPSIIEKGSPDSAFEENDEN